MGCTIETNLKGAVGTEIYPGRQNRQKKLQHAAFRQKTPLDNRTALCYTIQALEVRSEYRGVEQLEARRAHNPEVVGSSPASATRKKSRYLLKIAGFCCLFGDFWGEKLGFWKYGIWSFPYCFP